MAALAPNKFPEPDPASSESMSEVELPVFGSGGELSHSMLRIADTAALSLRPSGNESDDDSLDSPVFSSSADFSISSWLKKVS